jgi:hypothetical protein
MSADLDEGSRQPSGVALSTYSAPVDRSTMCESLLSASRQRLAGGDRADVGDRAAAAESAARVRRDRAGLAEALQLAGEADRWG